MKRQIIFLLVLILSINLVSALTLFSPKSPPPIIINNNTNLSINHITANGGDFYGNINMHNNSFINATYMNLTVINWIVTGDINATGNISGANILPTNGNNTGSIGFDYIRWNQGYFQNLNVSVLGGYNNLITVNSNLNVTKKITTQQLEVTNAGIDIILNGTDNIFIDGSTEHREITLGAIRHTHTAGIDGTRAYHFEIISNGFDDTRGIVVRHDLAGSSANIRPKNINLIGDVTGATNYHLNMIEFDKVGEIDSSGRIDAIDIRAGISPIHHHAGGIVLIETAFKYDGSFINVTLDFSSTLSNVTILDTDNDYIYIGQAAMFSDIEIILSVVASNPGTKSVFEYSQGASSWSILPVTDGTNGFRESGNIVFRGPDDWSFDTVNGVGSKFWVRIQRTTNNLGILPVESTIKVDSIEEYEWHKDGTLEVKAINTTGNVLNSITGNLTVSNITYSNDFWTTNAYRFIDDDIVEGSHRIQLGADNDISGTTIAEESIEIIHPENHTEGSYILELTDDKEVYMWMIKNINNSASGIANSWGVLPNNDLILTQKLNRSAISLLTQRINSYGIQSIYDYNSNENRTGLFSLYSLESQQLKLHNDLGKGGINVEGFADFILSDNIHFNVGNGAVHIFESTNFTSGFLPGDSFITFIANFPGVLNPFFNDQLDIGNWQVVSDIVCDSGVCAESTAAGSGVVSMTANFNTLNVNETSLHFVYSIKNLKGGGLFSVTISNSTDSELLYADATDDVTLSFQSIALDPVWNNQSDINLTFLCNFATTGKPDRECYVDTIKINGTFTENTTATVNSFNSEICFKDGLVGVDGKCERGILYDAKTDNTVIRENLNVTGNLIVGGCIKHSCNTGTCIEIGVCV